MARELPIRNGRLATDLDADGHRILNLPGGGLGTVSWDDVTGKPSFATVATSGSYNDLEDKPTIPAAVTVDEALDGTSANPVRNSAVKASLDKKVSFADMTAGFTGWTIYRNGVDVTSQVRAMPAIMPDSGGLWDVGSTHTPSDETWDGSASGGETATQLSWSAIPDGWDGLSPLAVYSATRTRIPRMSDIPTKTSDLTNDSGFLTQHQQLTPIYSSSPTYSGWTFEPDNYNGDPIEMAVDIGTATPMAGGVPVGADQTIVPGAVMRWTAGGQWYGDVELVATPIRTDIIGYTLGDQASMPLQPKGNYLTAHQDISGKEDTSNKVTSISAQSTDAQYPSAKCVWDNLRYSLAAVTPTVVSGAAAAVLNDRAVNAVDLSAEQSAVASIAFTAPAAVTGKARDFIVRVTLPAQSDAPQWSVNATLENADGELPALAVDASAAATTLLYFTETAAGKFLVKGETAKEVA